MNCLTNEIYKYPPITHCRAEKVKFNKARKKNNTCLFEPNCRYICPWCGTAPAMRVRPFLGVFRNSTVDCSLRLRAGDDTWLRKNVSKQ